MKFVVNYQTRKIATSFQSLLSNNQRIDLESQDYCDFIIKQLNQQLDLIMNHLCNQRKESLIHQTIYDRLRMSPPRKLPSLLKISKEESTVNTTSSNHKSLEKGQQFKKVINNSPRKQSIKNARGLDMIIRSDRPINSSPTNVLKSFSPPVSFKRFYESPAKAKALQLIQKSGYQQSQTNSRFQLDNQKTKIQNFIDPYPKCYIRNQAVPPSLNDKHFNPDFYRLAESICTTTVTIPAVKIDQSQIIEHVNVDNFITLQILHQTQHYKQVFAVDKRTRFMVCLKIIKRTNLQLIAKQIRMLDILKVNSVLKCFAGLSSQDSYIFVRECYAKTLKEIIPSINQFNIFHLIKQLLGIFQSLTSLNILYIGDIFENVCNLNRLSTDLINNIYKLKNFEQCQYFPQQSVRYFKVRYFRTIKELITGILQLDRDFYSRKQKKYIHKDLVSFIYELGNVKNNYSNLLGHRFLSDK